MQTALWQKLAAAGIRASTIASGLSGSDSEWVGRDAGPIHPERGGELADGKGRPVFGCDAGRNGVERRKTTTNPQCPWPAMQRDAKIPQSVDGN
jgi:hypothetical protein